MYHERKKGQVRQRYKLIGGKHSRSDEDGERIVINTDDEFHPTPDELAHFSDKFEPVMSPVLADEDFDALAPEPKTGPDRFAGIRFGSDDARKRALDSNLTAADLQDYEGAGADGAFLLADIEAIASSARLHKDDFSSDQAYAAWKAAGYPDMSKTRKTGHGGTTFSKKDVEDAT